MYDWGSKQNPDGGWAYNKGCSWTEPTAYALLAQTATTIDRPSFEAGLRFLQSTQRADGGWSPQPDVAESTWVTAVVALLPEEAIGPARRKSALEWMQGQTGRESSWSYKLQQRAAGNTQRFPEGWPWFPGAAAWVIPTAIGIIAFERALKRGFNGSLLGRVGSGRDFLIGRMCADGGWNHGGNRALGREGESYPETTGIALAALGRGADAQVLERAKAAARRHLKTCQTAEGTAWLRIGLSAQGQTAIVSREHVRRSTVDIALSAIADAPPERNPFSI